MPSQGREAGRVLEKSNTANLKINLKYREIQILRVVEKGETTYRWKL